MARTRRPTNLPPPFLKRIWLPAAEQGEDAEAGETHAQAQDAYPFDIPLFQRGYFELRFDNPVTIIIGENGTGKSTLLEAIADLAGFGEGGGGAGHRAVAASDASGQDGGSLGRAMRAAWLPKMNSGFFFRAETFFSLSRYLDDAAWEFGNVRPDFLSHSHGEGFMRFFDECSDQQGVYIFDEPESALSPMRQFEFLKILNRLARSGGAQIIMATHSPILMAFPSAELLRIDRFGISPTQLEDTPHFRLYREFVLYPEATVEAMIE
jgi:predicted ATPase